MSCTRDVFDMTTWEKPGKHWKIIAPGNCADAPIFRLAELGLVGNLHEILPILTHNIRAAQAAAHATRDS